MTSGTAAAAGQVVCGVDGSDAARHAVDWAADEAALRATGLELLHAWEPKAFQRHDWYGELLHDAGVEALQHYAERARTRRPGLTVTTDIVHDKAAAVLEEASTRAGLLVVGRRGLGGFTGLLLGSVSRKMAGRSHCPLLVAPMDETGEPGVPTGGGLEGRILVGVADATCTPALHAAFEEAELRHAPLHAVHAWSLPPVPSFGMQSLPVPADDKAFTAAQRDAESMLSLAVAPFRAEFPGVEVTAEVVHRPPVGAIVDLSDGARLTVVATHARRHDIGRTIGDVTYSALHHARSAVLMVPSGPRA
ncbi:universal stress protein [Yinghuangia seranimata]|uniref:universal stress protein n=1 Tax=Yinghuangia seranimata TaxID=408067 RepID=UPI00248ACEEB|nr:universal stress protein [Yinghuangia seranimata]MDI2125430.1 universal stress protein [Yinghuangia seranimata]